MKILNIFLIRKSEYWDLRINLVNKRKFLEKTKSIISINRGGGAAVETTTTKTTTRLFIQLLFMRCELMGRMDQKIEKIRSNE